MKRLTGMLLLACVAVVGNADDNKSDAAKEDLKKLAGTWTLVSMEFDGKKAQAGDIKDITAVVKGNTVKALHKDEVKSESTFSVDPTKKPKAIDATGILGPDKGKTSVGIYELDDETFKICYTEGKKRPTEFSAKAGSRRSLMVWKRAR